MIRVNETIVLKDKKEEEIVKLKGDRTWKEVILDGLTFYTKLDELRAYLLSHEEDIANGFEDFGSLTNTFSQIIKREPQHVKSKKT